MHKNGAIFLTATALLLFQFVFEILIVYLVYNWTNIIFIYSPAFVLDLALLHIIISVMLVAWSRYLAKSFTR